MLDDREAEIVEFYEKGMEAGTLFALEGGRQYEHDHDHPDSLPGDDDENDANMTHSDATRGSPKPQQERSCVEISSSRQSFTGSPGGRRDSYYAMVLQNVESHEFDDHNQHQGGGCDQGEELQREEQHQLAKCEDGIHYHRTQESHQLEEIQVSALECVFGASSQEGSHSPLSPSTTMIVEGNRVENGQLQEPSSSEGSSSSSISSLTLDRMDSMGMDSMDGDNESSLPPYPPFPPLPLSSNHADEGHYSSPKLCTKGLLTVELGPSNLVTPTKRNISNRMCEWQHQSFDHHDEDHVAVVDTSEFKAPVRRRVSFSNTPPPFHVTPSPYRGGMSNVNGAVSADSHRMSSSEKSLYAMLIVVGIAIAIVSLVPAFPTSSPSMSSLSSSRAFLTSMDSISAETRAQVFGAFGSMTELWSREL